MTVDDLLKRLKKKDYDKCILLSDGIGWTNIKLLKITDSNVYIIPDYNMPFED